MRTFKFNKLTYMFFFDKIIKYKIVIILEDSSNGFSIIS